MLPKLPDIQKLSKVLIRVLGQNASPFTLQGTNSYILGSGKSRLMIDTSSPNTSQYIENLKQLIKEEKFTIEKIIFTHWHADHVGSASAVQNLCWSEWGFFPTLYKFPSQNNPVSNFAQDVIFHNLKDGENITSINNDILLKVIFTPGHTDDHICLYWKEENVLFCGDIILGHGSGVFEDLTTYMASLELLKQFDMKTIYSAHGDVINSPQDKIEEYIKHRLIRIQQVQTALETVSVDGITDQKLLDIVYPEVTDSALRVGALKNMHQALDYLKKQNVVYEKQETGNSVWCLQSKINKL